MAAEEDRALLRLSLTLGLVAAASGAGADIVRDLVVQAVRGQGCAISESEAALVFLPLGLAREQVPATVEGMAARGEATLDEDLQTLTLAPRLCRVEPVGPARRALLIEERRAHGCALEEDDAAEIFARRGIAAGEVFDAGQALIAAGEASLGGGGSRLVLAPELCGG